MKDTKYKSLTQKKIPKNEREIAVLFALIELYLTTGKPVGSQTLLDQELHSLSSATIRNYCQKLEQQGYLKQPHTSGGRIPTEKAYELYADTFKEIDPFEKEKVKKCFVENTKEVASALNFSAEALSDLTKCACFISSPRFDQDFIQDVKLVSLSRAKILSVIITDFGLIKTETLYLDNPVDIPFLRAAEEYFLWRINKGEKPLFQNEKETKMAQRIYNEVMVRHVVGYANFPNEDVIRTGLSRLLEHPEFTDAGALANSLCLLEDQEIMRSLLREAIKKNELTYWIGDALTPHIPKNSECTVIAIPYYLNHTPAGSIALLGPTRLPYKMLFRLLKAFSEGLSQRLTENLYKYKITFRQASSMEKRIENKKDK